MTDARTETAEIINMLASTFDRYGWDDQALAGYLLALQDLEPDLVRRAAGEVLQTHVGKMPTPAELRRIALRLIGGEAPAVDDAWAEVLARARSHGRLRSPGWSHPLIGQAVESAGGWWHVCTTDDLVGARIAFTRAYSTHAERAERLALVSPGFTEAAALVADTTRPPRLHLLPPATEET